MPVCGPRIRPGRDEPLGYLALLEPRISARIRIRCLDVRETCCVRTANYRSVKCSGARRSKRPSLDSLHFLPIIGTMLVWHRPMASAIEAAEEIRIGSGRGGCAKRNADTS